MTISRYLVKSPGKLTIIKSAVAKFVVHESMSLAIVRVRRVRQVR